MQAHIERVSHDNRCRQSAGRIAAIISQLREPFRRNTIRWLEGCVARPISDLDEDLTEFFREMNPGIRETTMDSLEHVVNEAVRHFGQS